MVTVPPIIIGAAIGPAGGVAVFFVVVYHFFLFVNGGAFVFRGLVFHEKRSGKDDLVEHVPIAPVIV